VANGVWELHLLDDVKAIHSAADSIFSDIFLLSFLYFISFICYHTYITLICHDLTFYNFVFLIF
jgi:hypothetical protein